MYMSHVNKVQPIPVKMICIAAIRDIELYRLHSVAEKSPYSDQLAIRKTQLDSVAAASHVCTILHTFANLPF
jgi:hypothetical protein